MAKIYANASELIGGTPLVAFDKLAAKYEAPAKILAKLEYFNRQEVLRTELRER